MGMVLIFFIIIIMCIGIIIICDEADKDTQREYNGKSYKYVCVGMNVQKGFKDNVNVTLGTISQKEYKRRDKSGVYARYAWVEVGKETWTWLDEPINKEIFLNYASDDHWLPDYMLEEMDDKTSVFGRPTVGDYRVWVKDKIIMENKTGEKSLE